MEKETRKDGEVSPGSQERSGGRKGGEVPSREPPRGPGRAVPPAERRSGTERELATEKAVSSRPKSPQLPLNWERGARAHSEESSRSPSPARSQPPRPGPRAEGCQRPLTLTSAAPLLRFCPPTLVDEFSCLHFIFQTKKQLAGEGGGGRARATTTATQTSAAHVSGQNIQITTPDGQVTVTTVSDVFGVG